jgi:UDP-hydrolysing UDP-N-acetyl-D-glucosamine 2-epimerase
MTVLNDKRLISVVITARPSYSRVKTLLSAIKNHLNLDLHLIVTGSALLPRYGSVYQDIESDGFFINNKIHTIFEGESLSSSAKTTGVSISELSNVFNEVNPDIVVTVADRYETIATAIAASYMNLPVAHIQGGEVTGNIDEKVRHAITKLSDYHFVSNSDAHDRVVKLGENPKFVYNVGCPSIDIANYLLLNHKKKSSQYYYDKYIGVGKAPDLNKGYWVVMQHPVTNELEDAKSQIFKTFDAVRSLNEPVIWFWPNVDAGSDIVSNALRTLRESHELKNFHFFKNMNSKDFLSLLLYSNGLIGNSSVGIRECSFLSIPSINIGTRQNKRIRGFNVIDVPHDKQLIIDATKRINVQKRPKSSKIYGEGNSGEKIANILSDVPLIYHKTITY